MKPFPFRNILLFSGLLLIASTIKAQTSIDSAIIPYTSIKTIFQELQSYDKLVIETNLDSLIVNKKLSRDQAATLTASKKDGTSLQLDIIIEARGKFRRMACGLPPVKLNFNKQDLDSLGIYPSYDKLKLVTICHEEKESEQLLLKEYWTYRMYNELTDNSFKVHRFEFTYQDTEHPTRTITNYAFIIENNDEMAHRIGGELIDTLGITSAELTPTSYHQALLFNYMVGNTDWKLNVQKNLKLVKHPNHDLLTLVPYDFDFARLVGAPYMVPDTPKGAKADENNRYASGQFANEASLQATIQQFKELRKTGFRCYKECTALKNKEKGRMTYFMNSFFQMVKDKKLMKKTFLETE